MSPSPRAHNPASSSTCALLMTSYRTAPPQAIALTNSKPNPLESHKPSNRWLHVTSPPRPLPYHKQTPADPSSSQQAVRPKPQPVFSRPHCCPSRSLSHHAPQSSLHTPSPHAQAEQAFHAKAQPLGLGRSPQAPMIKAELGACRLGTHSIRTAEDPHARPCLDSHDLKPVGIHDGKPSIRFKKADKLRYLDLMKHVLVGKFSHGRPTIAIIKEFFIALKLKGAYNISLYDAKHLIIECDLLEDYTRLWVRLIWFIKNYPMRIFKWTADFDSSKESALTPVWVHFPGLPIFLYEEEGLLSVANSIGKPLRIDALNTNRVKLGVASVCVELDVSKPLVDKVWISFEDEDCPDNNEVVLHQFKIYEIPHYCSKCFHMGHSVENCKRDLEKERMQAEKGKMEMGPKPSYVKRRNLRRVYNPKAAHPSKTPKPADNVASTSASVPENNDDFVKFPKPSVRRGGAIQKWIERLNQRKLRPKRWSSPKLPSLSDCIDPTR
ncbi:hypothetical protein Leryth_026357 [Lithospermum erythrorhizon]|nr:hypothetical protein Leryth_026357 [Lithospermum erythrorhizon]